MKSYHTLISKINTMVVKAANKVVDLKLHTTKRKKEAIKEIKYPKVGTAEEAEEILETQSNKPQQDKIVLVNPSM